MTVQQISTRWIPAREQGTVRAFMLKMGISTSAADRLDPHGSWDEGDQHHEVVQVLISTKHGQEEGSWARAAVVLIQEFSTKPSMIPGVEAKC